MGEKKRQRKSMLLYCKKKKGGGIHFFTLQNLTHFLQLKDRYVRNALSINEEHWKLTKEWPERSRQWILLQGARHHTHALLTPPQKF